MCAKCVYNMYIMTIFAAAGGQTIPATITTMQADYYIIRQERFNQGRTQKELADMAQISLSTVIKAERGGSISPRSNRAIRDALGLK